MFYIDKLTQEVCLNRGDDATFTLHINEGSNLDPMQYKLHDEDCLYFAIEEPNQPFENAIVKKVINLKNNLLDKNGNITFDITSEDTLLLMPGLYYYEIKAKLYRGNQYRNGYLTVVFNENKYNIINKEDLTELSSGTFSYDNETKRIIFTEYQTEKNYYAELEDNLLVFKKVEHKDDGTEVWTDFEIKDDFYKLTYKQEQDKVNTIVQQTKWVVER